MGNKLEKLFKKIGFNKLEKMFKKNGYNELEEMFKKNGFIKVNDRKKRISISIDNNQYYFDYDTNTMFKIPNTDICFAIATYDNRVTFFFINKSFNPKYDKKITSPYRTSYIGLIPGPFKLVYHIEDETIIIRTDKNVELKVQIEKV